MKNQTDHYDPKGFTIDITNKKELADIANKFNCSPSDIIVAMVVLKTKERSLVYKWLEENSEIK